MEDITPYGEITGSVHHKSETPTVVTIIGSLCLAVGLLWFWYGISFFWSCMGAFNIYMDSHPEKGMGVLVAFALLAGLRGFIGLALVWLAFQWWDMQNVARKWTIFLLPWPLYYYVTQILAIEESYFEEIMTYRAFVTNFGQLFFVGSFLVMVFIFAGSFITSMWFRVAAGEKGWPMAGGIAFGICLVFLIAAGQLDDVERDTALRYCLPILGSQRCGVRMLDLDVVSESFLACQENIKTLHEASMKRDKVMKHNWENFYNKEKGLYGMKMLKNFGCIDDLLKCSEGGYYTGLKGGHWECSVHGKYDEVKVMRGKSQVAIGSDPVTEND